MAVFNPTKQTIGDGVQNLAGGGGPPLNPNLISAWPMNEGSGLTLHDTSTGGTNTATINNAGAVTWKSNAGLPGTTPLWNGTGFALASSVALTNFTGATPFSISAWLVGASAGMAIAGTLDLNGAANGWELAVNSASPFRLIFSLNVAFPSNALVVESSLGGVPTTGLNYVAVTYDGSKTAAGTILYINGVAQGNVIDANTLTTSAASGLPARFGARNNATFEATVPMAFVEIYSAVLTPTQIATYLAAGPGIY